MDFDQELQKYRTIFQKELTEDILPFWTRHVVDAVPDGFYAAVDRQGRPDLSACRSSVLYTRILWTYSAAARQLKDKELELFAHKAYREVCTHFLDTVHGGFFMELSPEYAPVNPIKHTYAHAFALYSLCEYYRLTQSEQIFSQIQSLLAFLEEKTKDPHGPGYLESFTQKWEPIVNNRMSDSNEPKSLNTHLHILEAYTAVVQVWNDPLPRERLQDLLLIFLNDIIKPDGHFRLFFEKDFSESCNSKGVVSFGHEIEGAWLLWEAAESLNNSEILKRLRPVVMQMVNAVEREGLDSDGGMFLESNRFGSHVRTNKHWWLQAETLVGFMNAYQMTGENRYWEIVKRSWDFIDRYVIDHEYGEWFTKVNRLGKPFLDEPADDPSPYYRNDRKADLWKCPYHNSRACLEMMSRIEKITKKHERIKTTRKK